MRNKEFDINYWENVWENIRIPQEHKPEHIHEIHQVLSNILAKGNLTLVEIGCAPGKWLAYFHNQFQYSVSGVEYAPQAYKKTIENLKQLSVPAELYLLDFFKFTHHPYDIVFSSGFIEHFENVAPVIEKMVQLCKPREGMVVTIIPSMCGVNRWISKTFRPQVAAGHYPIDIQKLISYHERCGLETVYVDYIGSLLFLPPFKKNNFSLKHPLISSLLNKPFRAWNYLVSKLTKITGLYPKLGFISTSIIYIGKKR